MDGFKSLIEDDVVEYDLGPGNDGKEQEVNVTPILTGQMIRDALSKNGKSLCVIRDADDRKRYLAVDGENVSRLDGKGMTFLEMAAYAGFDTNGLPGT